MSDQWIKVCAIEEMPSGTIRRLERANAPPIAVYRVGDVFHATEDTCTHGIGSLSEGTLDGDVIECPFHGGAFNVCTGLPESKPCTIPLTIYQVDIRNGNVYVAATPTK